MFYKYIEDRNKNTYQEGAQVGYIWKESESNLIA